MNGICDVVCLLTTAFKQNNVSFTYGTPFFGTLRSKTFKYFTQSRRADTSGLTVEFG